MQLCEMVWWGEPIDKAVNPYAAWDLFRRYKMMQKIVKN